MTWLLMAYALIGVAAAAIAARSLAPFHSTDDKICVGALCLIVGLAWPVFALLPWDKTDTEGSG